MADTITIIPSAATPDTITITPGVADVHTIVISPPNEPATTLTVTENNATVTVMTIGVPGPPGATINVPESVTATASTTLGGHRVVSVFDGIATYADCITNYKGQLGLTMSAVEQDAEFLLYVSGKVTEPSWNFTEGSVFLGNNGLLTQSMPTTGTVVLVGKAISATSIVLTFQQLYKRG